jgi:hypothetical protein
MAALLPDAPDWSQILALVAFLVAALGQWYHLIRRVRHIENLLVAMSTQGGGDTTTENTASLDHADEFEKHS